MMFDVIVVGAGPAGLSAAINIRQRGKSVLAVGNPMEENPLYKAPVIDNYPGLPGISGAQLLDALTRHAGQCGAEIRVGRVQSIAPMGSSFYVGIGSDFEECRAVVLAIGAQRSAKLPGEEALLGRGVSWCATCDGMLYRDRDVVVVGLSHNAAAEANFLHSIGCHVTFVSRKAPEGLDSAIPAVTGTQFAIEGEKTVTGVSVDGTPIPCQGAFILRETAAPGDLLPGLAMESGYVSADRMTRTSIPGVFACGDCTGLPLQLAKAVGEGLIAGQQAADYIDRP